MHCIISMQSLVRSHCMERSQGLLCRRLWPGGAFNCTKTETVLPGRFYFLAYDTSGLWEGDVERNDLRKENKNVGENYGTTAASGSGTNERRKKGRLSGKTDWFVHRLKAIRRRCRVLLCSGVLLSCGVNALYGDLPEKPGEPKGYGFFYTLRNSADQNLPEFVREA